MVHTEGMLTHSKGVFVCLCLHEHLEECFCEFIMKICVHDCERIVTTG